MRTVEQFLRRTHWNLQQVQDFIPLPMTPAAAMYVTGLDYQTGAPIRVARGAAARQVQKDALRPGSPARRGDGRGVKSRAKRWGGAKTK
jgi:hypothetical protein